MTVDRLSDLSIDALHCHGYGHRWERGPVEKTIPESLGLVCWVVSLHCPSCGKGRIDYVVPGTFELITRHYKEPEADDYRLVEPANRADFRREDIRRATAGAQ